MAKHRTRLGVLALALLATALALLGGFTASAPARTAAAPKEVSQPTVEGTPRVGSTLTANVGVWTGNPTRYTYQWSSCEPPDRTNCVAIKGATSKTYVPVRADIGHTIKVDVTAYNADGKATADSKGVGPVSANTAPANTVLPAIGGTAKVGEELAVSNGTWTASPTGYAYQWQRCDVNGSGCSTIAGSTGQTYGVRTADIGHTLRASVTARNDKGASTVTSAPTAVVTATGGGGGGGTSVSVADVAPPERLLISNVTFDPRVLTSRSAFVGRFKVTTTKGTPVRGALVYAIALPYGWIRPAPEAITGTAGIAEIIFQPTSALPLGPGAVVMFVRARKPGDNLLAGVSTRRLVQVSKR